MKIYALAPPAFHRTVLARSVDDRERPVSIPCQENRGDVAIGPGREYPKRPVARDCGHHITVGIHGQIARICNPGRWSGDRPDRSSVTIGGGAVRCDTAPVRDNEIARSVDGEPRKED